MIPPTFVPPTEWTNPEWARARELTGLSIREFAEIFDGFDERERDVIAALMSVNWSRVGAAMGDAIARGFAQGLGLSDEREEA